MVQVQVEAVALLWIATPVASVRGAVRGGHRTRMGQRPAQEEPERGEGGQPGCLLHGRLEGETEQLPVLAGADRLRRVQEQYPAGHGLQVERPLAE